MNKVILIIVSLILVVVAGLGGCTTIESEPAETAPTTESAPAETAVTAPKLMSPHNSATNIELTPTLLWAEVPNAKGYELWLSRDYEFSDIIHSVSLGGTAYQVRDGLSPSTRYYWMVIAKAKPADPETPIACSPVWTFTTGPVPASASTLILPPPEAPQEVLLIWKSEPLRFGVAFYFREDTMKIGYAQGELEGDWARFARIAGYFVNKVPVDDSEDFLQDLLVEMAKVKAKYEAKGKTLTEPGLIRVARYEVLGYWAKRSYRLFGLNCGNCTIEQRRECRTIGLSPKCPKGRAIRLLSRDTPGENGDGHKLTKLNELITDYKAGDPTHRLDARLDARHILKSLPKKLVKIGYKVYAGIPLENEEEKYLKHWQKAYRLVKRRDHLGERILKQLRKNPQGKTRSGLAANLNVYVRELNYDLNRLIKGQQIIAVKRKPPNQPQKRKNW